MTEYNYTPYGLIIISLFVALLLQILPMPTWCEWFRPDWVVLVVLYWVLTLPDRINVGVAWLIGLLLDGLNGTLLGEHAFALTAIAFLMSNWYRQVKNFPLWQSALVVGMLITIYKVLIWIIQGLIGQPPTSFEYLFSILTSMLLWPWVQAILTVKQTRVRLRTS